MTENSKKSTEETTSEIAQPSKDLLSSNESTLIQVISTTNPPHSQRALALLALDEGSSLTESAQRSGLTPRQVRYWRDRFLEKGLDIFPAELIGTSEPAEQAVVEQLEVEKPKKGKKGKKSKQGKKSKPKKGKTMAKKKDKGKKKDKKSQKGKKGKK